MDASALSGPPEALGLGKTWRPGLAAWRGNVAGEMASIPVPNGQRLGVAHHCKYRAKSAIVKIADMHLPNSFRCALMRTG